MEFVVVSGPVDGPHDCAKLSAEMDDYGEEGYITVALSTVISDGRPFATVIMEREAADHPYSQRAQSPEFGVIDGGAS